MSTAYGAYAMVVMCGPELADQILSDDGNWGSRAWVGMPLIPFALIASRLDIADNVLPILPFLILSNNLQPVPITFPPSPGVALCLLPWGRVIYKEAWRLIYHFSTSDDERAVAEQLRRQEQQNDPDIPFGVPLQLRARPPGAPRSIARLLFGSLLLPAVASMAGAVLGMIPYVRAKIPNVFLRNVIGGSLVILGRDCILYWEFLKKRSRSFGMGRRVLDYIRG
ncbi:hypothetical protein HDU99_005794 [Rhizoclosmatium hyalinum]|nr:hypothetical protein HDU99_005794 [Rhizoclosmatium hyalinum]